jgi:hypothetical protein
VEEMEVVRVVVKEEARVAVMAVGAMEVAMEAAKAVEGMVGVLVEETAEVAKAEAATVEGMVGVRVEAKVVEGKVVVAHNRLEAQVGWEEARAGGERAVAPGVEKVAVVMVVGWEGVKVAVKVEEVMVAVATVAVLEVVRVVEKEVVGMVVVRVEAVMGGVMGAATGAATVVAMAVATAAEHGTQSHCRHIRGCTNSCSCRSYLYSSQRQNDTRPSARSIHRCRCN